MSSQGGSHAQSLIMAHVQSHKDLPTQFLSGSKTLSASLVIASFGSSKPYRSPAFDLKIELDPSAPPPSVEKPLRYGKLPEIHHIFKPDPKSPPKIITLVFTAAVIAALPSLLFVVSFYAPPVRRPLLMVPSLVALLGREPQPYIQGFWQLTSITWSILSFHPGNGSHLLHVLHIVESLSDPASCCCCGAGHISKRKQGVTGSSGKTASWPAVAED